MRPIERIFLDMDGVLANFVEAAVAVFGYDEKELIRVWPHSGEYWVHRVLGLDETAFWDRIRPLGAEFWASMTPYPWRNKLWRLCEEKAPVTVLSMPSPQAESASGKIIWLQAWRGPQFRDYVFTSQKHLLAKPGALLIDDHEDQCREFQRLGGEVILFPRVWNSNRAHSENPVAYVRNALANGERR